MKRKIIALAICAVMLIMSLGTIAFADDKPVLRVAASLSAGGTETSLLYQLSQAYMEINPNITLDVFTVDNSSYADKIKTMLSGGDQVDIFWPHTLPDYVSYINNGYVHELNSFIEAEGMDLQATFGGITDAITASDGTLYAFPYSQHVWGIYYNKTMFDEKGVEYPHNDMTWEEYGVLMEKMTSGEGNDKVYGGHFQDWENCFMSIGTMPCKHTIVEENVDYASFLTYAYTLALDWQHRGIITDFADIQANNLSYHSLFINKKCASFYNGTWEIPNLIKSAENGELDFEWGVCQPPYNDKEGGQPGNTNGAINMVCMGAKTKYPQEAYDFIKWIATSEEAAKIIVDLGETPINLTDEVIATFTSKPGVPANLADVYEKTTFVLEVPMADDANTIQTIMNETNSLIMTESMSIEDALNEATQRVAEERASEDY